MSGWWRLNQQRRSRRRSCRTGTIRWWTGRRRMVRFMRRAGRFPAWPCSGPSWRSGFSGSSAGNDFRDSELFGGVGPPYRHTLGDFDWTAPVRPRAGAVSYPEIRRRRASRSETDLRTARLLPSSHSRLLCNRKTFPDLTFQVLLDSSMINAMALRLHDKRNVTICGGLALHPRLATNSLTFILLHETGHHLAEGCRLPRDPALACECAADHWAATTRR